MSKDFCGSGLRVGVLYSRNARLQTALNSVVIFGCVSNPTQYALARVLSDLDWVDSFVARNQADLARSYDAIAGACCCCCVCCMGRREQAQVVVWGARGWAGSWVGGRVRGLVCVWLISRCLLACVPAPRPPALLVPLPLLPHAPTRPPTHRPTNERAPADAEGLTSAGIPFLPAVAGMFVWVDLRAWLAPGGGWEAEAALWEAVCEECHVILTPGRACYAAEPGFFRLCFAWVPPLALRDALERLGAFLDGKQAQQQVAGAAADGTVS